MPSRISVKPADPEFPFPEPNMFSCSLLALGRRLRAEESVGAQSEGDYVDKDVERFAPVMPSLWC